MDVGGKGSKRKSTAISQHKNISDYQSSVAQKELSQTMGPLGMDYAMKHKLIDKRREIVQRAQKAVHGKTSATSTSIYANKKSFNFNDVLRAEKES